jgi:hypothetical protein
MVNAPMAAQSAQQDVTAEDRVDEQTFNLCVGGVDIACGLRRPPLRS